METNTERHYTDPHRLSDVRRELINVNEKIEFVNDLVDMMNQDLKPVPDRMGQVEESLAVKAQKMAELDERNKLHSAKIKLLQKEVRYEKLKSEIMKDYLKGKGAPIGDAKGAPTGDPGYAYNNQRQDGLGETNRPYQRNWQDVGTGQNTYLGQTSSEQAPLPPKSPRRDQQMPSSRSPAPDNPYSTHQTKGDMASPRQQSPDTMSPRKDPYEQSRVDDDSKYRQYAIPENKKFGQGRGFDVEEMQKQRRKEIYSVFDSTAINPQYYEESPAHRKYPWFDHKTHHYPGGFLFMRFDDSGYDSVNVAIKSQQSICRNAGGYLLGIARKQRIFVYELGSLNKQQNWLLSRNQPYDDTRMTENAVAAFWFTRKEAAENFFENCHRNRFREPCFPTPNGYEAYYVPLLSTPPMAPYNAFLFIEILLTPAKRDALQENMTQFEAEMRNDMSRVIPGCEPMVVSSTTGRVIFKPGLFISPYSKLFISRFQSQRDVDQIWRLGMIQALRHKWGLTAQMNVFSMTIDDTY